MITGAASGIGEAAALRFAALGWRVGLLDRDGDRISALALRIGGAAEGHVVEVLNRGPLGEAFETFCGPTGSLDVLFNSAGILEMQLLKNTALERQHAIIDVNVKGVLNSIDAAFPFLACTNDARIVSMSSVAAIYGVPEEAVYSASKFAIRGLTEALNIEFEGDGIWVCDVMPSFVQTPMISNASHKAKSLSIVGVNVGPELVAETVIRATHERRVHWFVQEEDRGLAESVDRSSPEEKRATMCTLTGF